MRQPLAAHRQPFIKMNGTGNDFVILDARHEKIDLTLKEIKEIADRANPVTRGCDQLIIIESPSAVRRPPSAVMRIYNADGGEVSACGNATRCVAWLLMEESGSGEAFIETRAGMLKAVRAGENQVAVDMGAPCFSNAEIPLSPGMDASHLPELEGLKDGFALGIGNPHAVFFVPDARNIDLAHIGPMIENRTDIFPEKVNVSVASMRAAAHVKLRVWERGAGLTLACGTAACATLVAAVSRGIASRKAEILLPGGALEVEWRADGNVILTGAVELEFKGML